jgi:acyl-CoA thioesterase-1
MVDAAQVKGARVLLIGMRLPPNYGPYATEFFASFADIARSKKTALLPFLLEPVAARAEFFQADNLHPIAAAQPLILEHVWPALAPLLK